MGNFMAQPDVRKTVDSFEYSGKRGAAVSMQGYRVSMEVTIC